MKKNQHSRPRSRKAKSERALVAEDKIPTRMPQLTDQLQTGIVLRFTTTGTGATASCTVTFANLLDAWLIAGTTTVGYQLFDFVRVRRVTIRAIPYVVSAAGPQSSATVGVEYPGLVAGGNAGGKQASNTGEGTAYPAYVSLAPDQMSAAAFWQPSSNDVAFVVRATNFDSSVAVGAIIDVHLSYKNSADVSPAIVSSAIAGASAGNLYFGGIDGGRLAATWARSVFVPRI